MNNHDELSYIKIITRIIDKMSCENDKIRREIRIHRIIILIQTILMIVLLLMGEK